MRVSFSLISLLIVLAVLGVLAKKQLTASRQNLPAPAASPGEQAQLLQQQYKQALDAAMQAPRPEPDDK